MTAITTDRPTAIAEQAGQDDGAPGRGTRHRRRLRSQQPPPETTARRRRVPTAMWCIGGLFVIFFAAASLQAKLIGGQEQLDRINQRIDAAQVRQDDLRQQEANLRSPAQIAKIATDEMGMVQAAPPMLVNPQSGYIGSPQPQAPPTTVAVDPASTGVTPSGAAGQAAAGQAPAGATPAGNE